MERTQDSIFYIETDIPPHMTANDWRRAIQRLADEEPCDFSSGVAPEADRRSVGPEEPQEPNGLEEVEPVRLPVEDVL